MMEQRDKMKHFNISKISPIRDSSCLIEEFEESEEEKFEYAIENSFSPPAGSSRFEPAKRLRRNRRPKKVDKKLFNDHSPERPVQKTFRKSIKTYKEDDVVKANARKVAEVEGCPRLFAECPRRFAEPTFHFKIETFPSPIKSCRNLYPEEDISLVEDMQEFLSSKIKKRPKQNYAPIKCAISKTERPPPKRLKTESPLKNVEDVDSDLSVVEATPPKIIKRYKIRKKCMKIKEFQSKSLLYSPELKKEMSFSSEISQKVPLVQQTEKTAKKRIDFDFSEEKEKAFQDDMGFSICSQIITAQVCIDEFNSPPVSTCYQIENVPSPRHAQIAEDQIILDFNVDESDTDLPQIQDESDNEIESVADLPQIQDESDNQVEPVADLLQIHDESDNEVETFEPQHSDIQDFSSPDIQHIQEIDNTSFSEICIRNTEPLEYEIKNIKQKKKPKHGSMLEKACAVKSRLEKDSKFFEYEIKNGLRSKTGSLVSFPLERLGYVVRGSLFFIFCRRSSENFVIVAVNVSEETLSRRFFFVHYPFSVVFSGSLNLTFLLVRNQIHVEDNFENNLYKIPFLRKNDFIKTLSTNVNCSISDLLASQTFMSEQTLDLFILHIFWTEENFCVVCKDEKDFCMLDFRGGYIEKVKSKKNLRHGVNVSLNGFCVTDVSPIDQKFKSLLEFSSGKNVETDTFYTLTPLGPNWSLKTKRDINKIKTTSSIENVLKENDPNKRYRINAIFVAADECGIFISDNLPSRKVKVVFTDEIDFHEKSLSVLDGALFRDGQFIVDKYTQIISS